MLILFSIPKNTHICFLDSFNKKTAIIMEERRKRIHLSVTGWIRKEKTKL